MYKPHHFPYLPINSQDYKKKQHIVRSSQVKIKSFNLKGVKIKNLQATEHLPLYRRSEAEDQKLENPF